MGGQLSRFSANAIDGLNLKTDERPPLTKADYTKLQQLINSKANTYQYNNVDHILISAYFLGYNARELLQIYGENIGDLEYWPEDDPIADSLDGELLDEYFGNDEYGLRYYELFRDELTDQTDWPAVVAKFLPQLLWRCFSHNMAPLVQLGAAVEADSPIAVVVALGMASTLTSEDAIDIIMAEGAGPSFAQAVSTAKNKGGSPQDQAMTVASNWAPTSHKSGLKDLISYLLDSRVSPQALVAAHASAEIVLAHPSFLSNHVKDKLLGYLAYHISLEYLGETTKASAGTVSFDTSDWTGSMDRLRKEPARAPEVRASIFAKLFLES